MLPWTGDSFLQDILQIFEPRIVDDIGGEFRKGHFSRVSKTVNTIFFVFENFETWNFLLSISSVTDVYNRPTWLKGALNKNGSS